MEFHEKLKRLLSERSMNPNMIGGQPVPGTDECLPVQSTINKWTTGEQDPKLSQMGLLSKFFNVSIAYLTDPNVEDPLAHIHRAPTDQEWEIIEMSRRVGVKRAAHVLESVANLGYPLAVARLHGLVSAEAAPGGSSLLDPGIDVGFRQDGSGHDSGNSHQPVAEKKPRKGGQ